MLDKNKLDKISKSIDKTLAKESPESLAQLFTPNTTPLGWVSLETKDHLPECLAEDFFNGGTPIIIRTAEDKMHLTHVVDHNTWYYDVKNLGAIEWFNGTDIEKQPYIVKFEQVVIETRMYNPNYGDNRVCKCGHPYYRHFDTYEEMSPIGCKYCGCQEFKERKIIKNK